MDLLPEGAETFVFRLYPMGNSTALVDAASETITVNLANVVLDEIQADLTWASRTNAHGNIVDIKMSESNWRMDTQDLKDLISLKIRWIEFDKQTVSIGF